MKKIKIIAFFCLCVLLLNYPCVHAQNDPFPPFIYKGRIAYDIEGFLAGEQVRLYEAEHQSFYLVGRGDGKRIKVPWDAIVPLAKETKESVTVTAEKIVAYVGENMYSQTDYLLWVDLFRAKLYVLEYADEGWQLIKVAPCSVGDSAHPTPSGKFTVQYKCAAIGKENQYLCRYALCFYGGYMVHSTLFDWAGEQVLDDRLGARISHGCVRVSSEMSLWLYQNIPIGTAVYVR